MKRNYGIDGLRLILMLMVAVLHVLGHGGVLDAAGMMSPKYVVLWLVESAVLCAVNCFALVSGYVQFGSKYRLSSLVLLYLQILLYSLGIGILGWILKPEWFSASKLITFLFPVSGGRTGMRRRMWDCLC